MISTGGQLTILESVDSTNNYAMGKVRTGQVKHGDGFFAMEQVQGKGQRGKTWVTEPGTNIILTLAMQPVPLQLNQQFQFSMAIALAVHDFFATHAGDETTIKWPNDIYWRDRKAGGILIESIVVSPESSVGSRQSGVGSQKTGNSHELFSKQSEEANGLTTIDCRLSANSWQWAIVGMGVNINQTIFPENIRNAVSLKQITGKDWDVMELANNLCGHVQNRFAQLVSGTNLLAAYNAHLFKKGQTATFKKESRVFEGTIKEVNAAGELVVMTAMEEHFSFGEVQLVV